MSIILGLCLVLAAAAGCGGSSDATQQISYKVRPNEGTGGAVTGSVLATHSVIGGFPPFQEPVAGTFSVTAQADTPAVSFRYALSTIHLRSESHQIDGDSGVMFAEGDAPSTLTMTMTVSIDGRPVTLRGEGGSHTFTGNPPMLTNFILTAAEGYVLQLFAAPTP